MAQPNPWDPSSIADVIRQQAAAQAKQAGSSSGLVDTGNLATGPADPLSQLMEQINNIRVQPTSIELLMQQAQGTAGAQFDPLIAELQGQMSATQKRGRANQGQAKRMYGDLATDIAAEMPQITNQMAAASKETQNRYDSTQAALQGEYNQQAEAQNALFQKLGIQAAAPEASQQGMEDQAYFQNQMQTDETAAMQLLNEMKNADVSYNRQSSDNTRLAGVNASQDIGAQLENYLQQAGGKLSGLKAGRESAIQSALAQLKQQDNQRINTEEDQQYDRLMEMFNLQLKMQDMQGENQPASLFKGSNGPSGAANFLGEQYGGGDTFSSNAIMDAINDIMQSKEAVEGSYDSGEKDAYGNPVKTRTTDAKLQDMLRRRMSEEGQGDTSSLLLGGPTQFSAADINNAIAALMAYQGKLK